ncbi:glutamate--cysteine ligase [Entomobacter blattae]|uniref:Glutamate--cysteine ligase n=1 Tax=Entomobacter blattae TaxID=2762277 RepID=A0A7H1NQG5_9PROT|nr:glutamate--cysteine ligase [Entomobacter blattae]QNT78025.1 Glutamate--cysteine ligase EgtA [Entomobacter blattae]
MSNPSEINTQPITSFEQMVAVLSNGIKPRQDWRIGTEHEKFGFVLPSATDGAEKPAFSPPAYDHGGIRAVLTGMQNNGPERWAPIMDGENLIGLKGQGANKGRSISLEPAGQFELSGAPLATLHETHAELHTHFQEVREVAQPLGLGFAPLGFHPENPRKAMPWMPKSRYAIMRRYMPLVGQLGLDMMTRTCTVQVNLDFSSEEDMRQKMQVAMAFQPVATALFANSPFYEGQPNGLMSNRARIWTDTDNGRSGMPECFFSPDFSFATYVNWALDVPMYFIIRDGKMIDVAGCSFRAWLEGTPSPLLVGYSPTIGDFDDHLTTVFPEVRLKQFLEMRGADAGSPEMMVAFSALWVGLLYDEVALKEAVGLAAGLSHQQCVAARLEVPQKGIGASLAGKPMRYWALRLLELAEAGLKARGVKNAQGEDERQYLAPLFSIAHGGKTQAEHWLERFAGPWEHKAARIFMEAQI